MSHKLSFRQYLLSFLALWHDLSWKEVGAATGMPAKQVSQHLRRGALTDATFERLLAAIPAPPGAVEILTACLESLAALEQDDGLTAAERREVERAALLAARSMRKALTEKALLSRETPPPGYPQSDDVRLLRKEAGEVWERLAALPPSARLEVVRTAPEYQGWALCERICQESVTEASRNVERAAGLAQLAQEVAERVPGPEDWRSGVRGYAAAHVANTLRVSGDLNAADALLERAKHLCQAGSDPALVLDPGRFFNLEASLRRDQRRFPEALEALDQAQALGQRPELAMIQKGFTLEIMGEYRRALETLLQAAPLVERNGDSRLLYMLRFNLAVNYCHIGHYKEATELLQQVRELAMNRGDEIEVIRVTWLDGRIAAGVGRRLEARRLLAQARRDFVARKMGFDASLTILEEAVLLLEEGQTEEVKKLSRGLAVVFQSNGVHREALAALRLFQEAAERETATADLVRRVLRFLYQARHDQGLRFTS
ncbi:MAG TPA: tetratricopeptide repeat protein [Solirubrobacterales bacterium]|nr:tetratricopeptide repeat protein [Solirubrobacterales bacterium]